MTNRQTCYSFNFCFTCFLQFKPWTMTCTMGLRQWGHFLHELIVAFCGTQVLLEHMQVCSDLSLRFSSKGVIGFEGISKKLSSLSLRYNGPSGHPEPKNVGLPNKDWDGRATEELCKAVLQEIFQSALDEAGRWIFITVFWNTYVDSMCLFLRSSKIKGLWTEKHTHTHIRTSHSIGTKRFRWWPRPVPRGRPSRSPCCWASWPTLRWSRTSSSWFEASQNQQGRGSDEQS